MMNITHKGATYFQYFRISLLTCNRNASEEYCQFFTTNKILQEKHLRI